LAFALLAPLHPTDLASGYRPCDGYDLATHRRTISAALRATGHDQASDFARYHEVLNRSRWPALAAARLLLGLLIATFVASGPVVIGLDDTIERRWGAKIKALGICRDPVRSSHGHFVKASVLRWLSAMLLVPIPWARRVWALPFLTMLVPSERWAQERGVRHKTLVDCARQMLLQISRWLPNRQIIAVSDSSFAVIDLLEAIRHRICMVTRLRLDARLFEPAAPRDPHAVGRPRRTGARLPTLAQRLVDPATSWQLIMVPDWYGGAERAVEIASGCAMWNHPGRPVVPLRWLLVRDSTSELKPQAFLATDTDIQPADMLSWFIRRWTIEVTFAEVRRHLGVETQRQWSDKAIARTTPILLGLYALIAIYANDLQRTRSNTVRTASWYRKDTITFSDALAAVRRQLWADETISLSPSNGDPPKVRRDIFDRLADLACYPA
jgi:hypothetical protein